MATATTNKKSRGSSLKTHTLTVRVEGLSAYSQSKAIEAERDTQETSNDHENRTWKQRAHVDAKGQIIVPGLAFKKILDVMGPYLGQKIPGRRNATYTKHFKSGVLVTTNPVLFAPDGVAYKGADIKGERLFVPSDGKTGGGSRVWKTFPVWIEWYCDVSFLVVDPILTEEVVIEHLELGGQLCGVGRWRPQNGGLYGRFKIASSVWA